MNKRKKYVPKKDGNGKFFDIIVWIWGILFVGIVIYVVVSAVNNPDALKTTPVPP